MIDVELTRADIMSLADHFAQASNVTPQEDEDKEAVRLFKYRAGRNANTCIGLTKQFTRELPRIQGNRTEDQILFEEAQEALMESYAEVDDEKEPIYDPETRVPVIPKKNRKACNESLAALKLEHPEAIAEYDAMEKRVQDYMTALIPVPLLTVPWSAVPNKLTGTYIAAIESMLTELPNEGGGFVPDGQVDE